MSEYGAIRARAPKHPPDRDLEYLLERVAELEAALQAIAEGDLDDPARLASRVLAEEPQR